MKGNNAIIIGLITLVLAVIIGLQLFFSSFMPNYSWNQELYRASDQPYGLKYFYELIDTEERTVIESTLPLKEALAFDTVQGTYIHISENSYIYQEDGKALLDWVEKGNAAFFSTTSIPWFLDTIINYKVDTALFYEFQDSAIISLNPSLDKDSNVYTYYHRYVNDTVDRSWLFYTDSSYYWEIEPNTNLRSLGRLGYGHNFFELPYGDGKIYLHLEPILFTNYFLLTDQGFDYASKAISVMDEGNIYWAQYHTEYKYDNEESSAPAESPLKVIFQDPALSKAWIVFLIGIGLFMLFRSKRQQRVIPMIHYPENTSVAYARALAALYHRSGEPKFLASEMMTMFHNYNRRKYQLEYQPTNEQFAEDLARKATVKPVLIKDILALDRKLVYSDLAKMAEIISLYELLNIYYKASK
jgi:hypothetical protein